MKNILVTGGAGFIGSNFIHLLTEAEKDSTIVNLDILNYAGNLANLENLENTGNYHFVQMDICDETQIEALFEKFDFDTVVHFAAESHVDRSIHGPKAFVVTNVMGTFTLLEAARKHWDGNYEGKLFHHVSTDEVFGSLSPTDPAFTETTPYDPRSPYSSSKASSDHLVRAYHHTYGMPVTISNCSNNYGPYQYPEKLIPVVISNCLEGKPIPIYGDGMQVRDWLYVMDHCEAIYEIMKQGKVGETYNVGGNNELPNLNLVKTICKAMDQELPDSEHVPHENLITFVVDRLGHDRRYAMDISKINRELGWSPKESFETGMEKTVNWYLSNRKWIEDIHTKEDFKNWEDKNYNKRQPKNEEK